MEENPLNADKSQNVLESLRGHLISTFPNLSSSLPLSQIRNDTAGNISMVMPLKRREEPTVNSTKGYINMGLPLDTPTFMLQVCTVGNIDNFGLIKNYTNFLAQK